MIDYSPFWETLRASKENWYTLTNKHHMSHSTRVFDSLIIEKMLAGPIKPVFFCQKICFIL